MISPYTKKQMARRCKYNAVLYRGKEITFKQEYFICTKTKMKFTSEEQDKANLNRCVEAFERMINPKKKY